jgi:uncharacterized repeat protein (TIGR03803 family)
VSGGDFYGIDGSYPSDALFKMTTAGVVTLLNDSVVSAAFMQASDGNFYGTTVDGGTGESGQNPGGGTVFQLTTSGKLTTIYSFCGLGADNCVDGTFPQAPVAPGRGW